MKPDWSKAPDWAQWWACDECGVSYWFSKKPLPDVIMGIWVSDFREQTDDIYADHPDWRNSLQKRPE